MANVCNVCAAAACLPGDLENQKSVSDPVVLELQAVVSGRVGAEN